MYFQCSEGTNKQVVEVVVSLSQELQRLTAGMKMLGDFPGDSEVFRVYLDQENIVRVFLLDGQTIKEVGLKEVPTPIFMQIAESDAGHFLQYD